jgi:D-3-phosphoglycerate dehydrogenase / 2-oxoglutarate reductase
MTYRVAISPSSFAVADKMPMDLLIQAGIEVVPNPYSRRLTEEEIIVHLNEIDGLIAGLEPLNRKVLQSAPRLKAIARVGIGMDNLDQEAADELNIRVSNTPDGPTNAVAELCLAALLAIGRRLIHSNSDLHKGIWKKRLGFGLKDINVLIIGYGRIGRRFADFLRFFGAKILVSDPAVTSETLAKNEKSVTLEQGLEEADVISLHASGITTILGKNEFKKIRPDTVLLNSARGELVDEAALIQALDNNIISGAWIDTFSQEPYNGPLNSYEQVLLTPHVSTYTSQCRRSMEESAVRNMLRDLNIDVPEK